MDGIITDDSDVFLFGGETVYRKFFEQASFVESYQLGEIKSQLGLDRQVYYFLFLLPDLTFTQALINLALMLGSDYTNGVKGIGIVFAVEVLNEFGNLEAFRDWLLSASSLTGDSSSSLQKKLVCLFLSTEPH